MVLFAIDLSMIGFLGTITWTEFVMSKENIFVMGHKCKEGLSFCQQAIIQTPHRYHEIYYCKSCKIL